MNISHKYSPVGNVFLMSELLLLGMIDSYQLLLAHEVVANEVMYRAFAKSFRERHPGGIIILDNSLIELGGSVNYDVMVVATNIVKPDFIVLPDVLMDMKGSIDAFAKAYYEWLPLLPLANKNAGFLGVVQGVSQNEMRNCAAAYACHSIGKNKHLKALGLPRAYTNKGGSRVKLADFIWQNFRLPIHLMGFSEHFSDDMRAVRMPGVMGIDSATPLRAGFEDNRYCYAGGPPMKVQRENFFLLSRSVTADMIYNIAFIRGIIDGSRL